MKSEGSTPRIPCMLEKTLIRALLSSSAQCSLAGAIIRKFFLINISSQSPEDLIIAEYLDQLREGEMADVFEMFREILLEVQVFGDYFVKPPVQTVPSEVPAKYPNLSKYL